MNVCVIIVNWNAGELLRKCIDHLASQSVPACKIIVVDNASTDHSIDFLREPGSETDSRDDGEQSQAKPSDFAIQNKVQLIALQENRGFAEANNIAVKHVQDSQWIALLNPDAFPKPDWLACLLAAAQSHKQYDCFASRLLMHGKDGFLDGAGDDYHFCGMYWRHGHGRAIKPEHEHNREVFSACAGAALYKTSAFCDVGGFDERFFCYGEDADLGFRLRLKGYRCLYVADAIAEHIGSATTGYRSDFSVYYGHRNLEWVYFKNMPYMILLLSLPVHILMILFSILIYIPRGKARVVIRSKIDAMKKLPLFLKERLSQPPVFFDAHGLVKLMKIDLRK